MRNPDATPARAERRARIARRLGRRYRAERRFRMLGVAAVSAALLFLAVLLVTVGLQGSTAFVQTEIRLDIVFDADTIGLGTDRGQAALGRGDYQALVKKSLRAMFPDVRSRSERRRLYGLVSSGAGLELRDLVLGDPGVIGTTRSVWLPASDDVDMVVKGRARTDLPASDRRVGDRELGWIETLRANDRLETRFNVRFFANGDSREPELAGILAALVGSLFSMLVCLALAFPIGVMAAIYLEEFAPRTRWTDLIEVNINNLAAVPSIIFGLLGLAVFLNLFGLPRSAPLVGGMVLALMTLPTIIIAARSALKAVPPSVREAALAIGASPVQTVLHHTLPLAMPGILTGAIVGMARALGDTAPLLMIGMVAFVVDIPRSIVDAASALPVQIFLWADSPERAFEERTAAAIIVLLVFLIAMNLTAVLLRRKFERRW